MNDMHYNIGILGARIFLGILFFMQGYDKVFTIGVNKVVQTFRAQLSHSQLPLSVVTLSAYLTSYIELSGGLLLILGFMKYTALYALGFDLIMVAVVMGLINPLWDTRLVLLRLILLLLLLLTPETWDLISLDHFLSVYSR